MAPEIFPAKTYSHAFPLNVNALIPMLTAKELDFTFRILNLVMTVGLISTVQCITGRR